MRRISRTCQHVQKVERYARASSYITTCGERRKSLLPRRSPLTTALMESKNTKKRIYETAVSCWCFTWNNYPEELDLEQVFDKTAISYAVLGIEKGGKNGTRHIQGFVVFHKRLRMGQVSMIIPKAHWERMKGTQSQASEYCKKEGNFVEVGELKRVASKRVRNETQENASRLALAAATVREGMDILAQDIPFEYLVHGEAMERNLKKRKAAPYEELWPIDSFSHSKLTFGKKATLLWGPTGTGKTCFALAHFKNPLVVSHIDKLKLLSPDNDAIVFDDMSFKHWPKESVIHLLDFEITRDINVRYGTVIIPAKTIKIFTHNTSNPFYEADIEEEQKEAIERRLVRVHVVGSLINKDYVRPPTQSTQIHLDSDDSELVDEIYYGRQSQDDESDESVEVPDSDAEETSAAELLRNFDEAVKKGRPGLFVPKQTMVVPETPEVIEISDESSEIF